ncbi:exosome complex component RRP43 [Apis mellifera caucasica]|uniref:Ribosomal RNA-processing protein 43 n=1 Tax=Apis mellifera TaxID=7460 RepID=A0A7M7RAN5_APIME|nr:exosome complex component RRP43 [Apis mellifera]KAG6797182.1 exosome complex component RRP43 [Apis mellifera caucasica]KAG9438010.1 exosome complex component RRP43 [Apis mellifera carnica]|eukprot:XP_624000.1 exosome complex component RRP43 [Apis mellifera]
MDSQYKIIHPVKYLQDHLAQDVRPDGRQFLSFRPISVNISSITHADSSAIFKIGNTTIVCGIKSELAVPKAESPECGYIVPNIELPPLCSPKFRPGPPSDQAQVITKLVENILRNSAAIDLKELCVYKGKLVWVLYCDLVCINYDGSIIDACIGALTATLNTLTLPEIFYNVETGHVSINSTKRIRFPIKALPVSITFAIFDNQLLIADPTDDEESLCLGKLTIVMNEEKICCIHKPGGIPISQDIFLKSLIKSKKRAELVRSLIDSAISTMKQEVLNGNL